MKLSGVIPPMLTPAMDDGMTVDCERLKVFTRWLLDSGVDGLFIGASAGEAAMLDRSQRQASVETVVSVVQGRVPVIAGVSAHSTSQSLQFARDAEASGANYVMGLPPGLFPLSEDELVRHFAAVSDSIGIPTFLYNFPEITGGKIITPKIAATLSRNHNVVGIKDSSGVMANTRAYRRACGDEFALFMGQDLLSFPHLATGGDGIICAGMNIAQNLYRSLYNAFRDGDFKKAIALQDAVSPIAEIYGAATFPSGVKACLTAQGIPTGPPFLPVAPANEAQTAIVMEAFGRMMAAGREIEVV